MRPHICLALKIQTRSAALSELGKVCRQAIGVRAIALCLLVRGSPVLRRSAQGEKTQSVFDATAGETARGRTDDQQECGTAFSLQGDILTNVMSIPL